MRRKMSLYDHLLKRIAIYSAAFNDAGDPHNEFYGVKLDKFRHIVESTAVLSDLVDNFEDEYGKESQDEQSENNPSN